MARQQLKDKPARPQYHKPSSRYEVHDLVSRPIYSDDKEIVIVAAVPRGVEVPKLKLEHDDIINYWYGWSALRTLSDEILLWDDNEKEWVPASVYVARNDICGQWS